MAFSGLQASESVGVNGSGEPGIIHRAAFVIRLTRHCRHPGRMIDGVHQAIRRPVGRRPDNLDGRRDLIDDHQYVKVTVPPLLPVPGITSNPGGCGRNSCDGYAPGRGRAARNPGGCHRGTYALCHGSDRFAERPPSRRGHPNGSTTQPANDSALHDGVSDTVLLTVRSGSSFLAARKTRMMWVLWNYRWCRQTPGDGREAVPLGVELHVTQETDLRQALSPLAVQVLHFLSLTQPDVDAVVAAGLSTNPVLITGPPSRCRWCAERLRSGRCPRCAGTAQLAGEPAAAVDVMERLRLQARLLVSARLTPLVELVIEQLDDGGLLRIELGALADVVGAPTADVQVVIDAVRAAGPAGVASASPMECLRVQAQWHARHGSPPLLAPIVEHHLSAVADGDHLRIAAALGASIGEVDAAVKFLRARLRPSAFTGAGADRAVAPPDVIVRRREGDRLDVEVLGAADLGLGLDGELVNIPVAGEAAVWLAERASDARSLMDMVDRRAAAMRRVADGAVQAQRGFVLFGPRAHVPLTRTALAQALDLHPSTVSMAVQGALVAMPDRRVVPLAAFFGGAVSVQAYLADLLASADPPANDAEACTRLTAAGYRIARRTVAKYRLALQPSGTPDGSPLRKRTV